ncbi:MAG: carbohydrate kinase family protein [Haloarculaceae archaeon]
MAYEALLSALPSAEGVTVAALPDGSVDRYFRVRAGDGYVDSREAFAERVATGVESFRTDHWMTRPGGQSVNMAQQAAALGDDVTVYGHLDHAVFGPLPAERVSMGRPAIVSVLSFGRGDLMLSEESDDLLAWTLDDLAAVTDLETAFEVDAVCWGNWASLPGATAALAALPDRVDAPDAWFVFDPGNVTHATDAALEELLDVLGGLEDPFEVALSVDRHEAERLGEVVGVDGADDHERLAAVRDRTGVSGVVLHDAPAAHAATREGTLTVANFDTEGVVRTAGAGDRFSGGLAHALAHGLGWEAALQLGNACASVYVERDETAGPAELLRYVRERR